jgi:hypothetical protein
LAPDFIKACNELIIGCRVDRPEVIREAVYDVLRWEEQGALGALGAEVSPLEDN